MNLFGEKVLTEMKDSKGRIVLRTIYSGGWYKTIAHNYVDHEAKYKRKS